MVVNWRGWRQVPPTMFQFTTTDLAALRIAVLQAFHDAAVHEPTLTRDQVVVGLRDVGWDEPLDDDGLDAALAALVGWQLLEATQDHAARYATPEEFERRNLRWALTPTGQAAIAGVLHSLDVLRRTVSLQPATLDAIGDGLADLVELVRRDDVPDARITTRLTEVEHHVQSLVDNVREFNRILNRLQRDDATTDEVFLDVKQRVTTYLQEFVDGVARPAARIARLIDDLDRDPGLSVLRQRALTGANLLQFDEHDPATAWLDERARRWEALVEWFAPADGRTAQIDRVLGMARQAILSLLRVLERRWEARRRTASLRDDLLTLARAFATVPTDVDAHRLFGAAFGMWPSRHHHLLPDDPGDTPSGTSWLDAPSVPVAAILRTSGSTSHRGRPAAVRDPALARAHRQAAQAAELARRESVRRQLLTDGTVDLADLGDLEPAGFDALLELLSVALAASRATDGVRRATSIDGQVEIELHPPRSRAAGAPPPTVRLRLPTGILTAPAYRVAIRLVGRPLVPSADEFEEASA